MESHLGERVAMPRSADNILEHGWLGRKTGRGFYTYPAKGERTAKPVVSDELIELIVVRAAPAPGASDDSPAALQARLTLPMVNEAARLLAEGVADSADAIDLATLLGMGFPQFRGGLASYADSVGAPELVRQLERLALRHGPRFEPAPLLRELASTGRTLSSFKSGASA
jgi:3-hydroxyacyl-CoA dehydrogenase